MILLSRSLWLAQTNTYVVASEPGGPAVVVDVPPDPSAVLEMVRRAYANGAPLVARRRNASEPAPPPVRLLTGLHDIDAFAEEISRHPWLCETVAEVARRP